MPVVFEHLPDGRTFKIAAPHDVPFDTAYGAMQDWLAKDVREAALCAKHGVSDFHDALKAEFGVGS